MRLRDWFWRLTRRDRDLDEEIHSHLEMARRDRVARGEDPREAEYAVQREFGNPTLVREVTREMWGWASLDRVAMDLRYAVRSLKRSPGFAAAALLSLVLGIGANTVSFSISEALLLRPLPIGEPGEVLKISGEWRDAGSGGLSYPDFLDLRARAESFSGVTAHATRRFAVARDLNTVPRMVFGAIVSQDFFQNMGVEPVLGRAFTAEESGVPGRDAVAIVSHEFWRTELAASTQAIGASLRINGTPHTIVGVAPAGFTGMSNLMSYAVYVPAAFAARLPDPTSGASLLTDRNRPEFDVRARLKSGAAPAQAQAEVHAIGAALANAYPGTNRVQTFSARTDLQNRIHDSPETAALVALLLALALLVLLIACANVANLLLARARARSREIAIRSAIGAGSGRLFQQLLTESAVLAVCGGLLAVALAHGLIRHLASFRLPTDTPLSLTAQLDHRVLLFSLLVSLLSALFFGALPAWRLIRRNLSPALKAGELHAGDRVRTWGRSTLAGVQVALCLVLLVCAAALFDGFRRMSVLDPGIRTSRLLMMEFDPMLAQYGPEQSAEFFRQLSGRVRDLPGVRAAALSRAIPFRPNFHAVEVIPEGYVLPAGQTALKFEANVVDHGYFAAAGVPLLRGRAFTPSDRAAAAPVVIVNEEFARRYYPGRDALDAGLRLGSDGPVARIVGVAKTAKYLTPLEAPTPYLYLPFEQAPQTRMTLLTATEGDPAALAGPLFDTVRSLDANMPVFNVYDMQTYYQQGVLAPARLLLSLVASIGLGGLLLATLGLYGLVSYTVSRRTREIGIRMAVGAARNGILGLVLKQGLTLALAGVAAGTLLSVPLFRILAAGLAGLGGLNAWWLVAAPAALIAITLTACYVPAARASRIDPVRALRVD